MIVNTLKNVKNANMEKKYNVTDFIIKTVYEPLKEFIAHYETHGMSLPPEFASDPGAWLSILKKIEFSFDSIYATKFDEDRDHRKLGLNDEALKEYDDKINKGLELFGKYLLFYFD